MPHHLLPLLGCNYRVKGSLKEPQGEGGPFPGASAPLCHHWPHLSHPYPAPTLAVCWEEPVLYLWGGHLSPRAFWKGRRQKDVEGGIVARKDWERGLTPYRPTDRLQHQRVHTQIHTHPDAFYFTPAQG